MQPSSVKAAIPDEPKQAAKDAVSSAKDSLPEPPSNPFQGLFSGKLGPSLHALPVFAEADRASVMASH